MGLIRSLIGAGYRATCRRIKGLRRRVGVPVFLRLAERGFSPNRFQLTMARTDIANYLRLAPETVSRVLRRFDDDGLLHVERREVQLLDRDALMTLAAPVLRE